MCLTNASVEAPWRPFDDDDDRRRIEHCGIKAARPPWDWGHPPQNTGRVVRVQVVCTRLLCALATASRRRGEPTEFGATPVGWQRWRRQLLEQTRAQSIVCAQGGYGICPIAAFVLRVGVKLTDVPPSVGARQAVLAKYELTAQG